VVAVVVSDLEATGCGCEGESPCCGSSAFGFKGEERFARESF
jgi:hypothetical protein